MNALESEPPPRHHHNLQWSHTGTCGGDRLCLLCRILEVHASLLRQPHHQSLLLHRIHENTIDDVRTHMGNILLLCLTPFLSIHLHPLHLSFPLLTPILISPLHSFPSFPPSHLTSGLSMMSAGCDSRVDPPPDVICRAGAMADCPNPTDTPPTAPAVCPNCNGTAPPTASWWPKASCCGGG